jgi:hypothetical protein
MTKLIVVAVTVVAGAWGLTTFEHRESASEQYHFKDYSDCGTNGNVYLQKAAREGDLQAQQTLDEQRAQCERMQQGTP